MLSAVDMPLAVEVDADAAAAAAIDAAGLRLLTPISILPRRSRFAALYFLHAAFLMPLAATLIFLRLMLTPCLLMLPLLIITRCALSACAHTQSRAQPAASPCCSPPPDAA